MRPHTLLLVITSLALGQAQNNVVVDFLQDLIRNPSRVPVYSEGLKVVDQIATMPAADVSSALPVIFEALAHEREAVNMNAGLALYAVSLRPDARNLLEPRLQDILVLLRRSDNRIKMTAPMVLGRLRLPNERVVPALSGFVMDGTQPSQARATVICTLRQLASNDATARQAVATALQGRLSAPERIAFMNAIACQPTDDLGTAQAVGRGLMDDSADVRAAAIQVIGRLGPRAVKEHEQALWRIAGRTEERPDVRALAERVATMKW